MARGRKPNKTQRESYMVRLDPRIHAAIKERARLNRRMISGEIELALEAWLTRQAVRGGLDSPRYEADTAAV